MGMVISAFVLFPYIRAIFFYLVQTLRQIRSFTALGVCALRQRFVQVTVIPPRMGPRNMTTGHRQVSGTA